MQIARWLLIASIAASSQALAESTATLTVALGGDNHADGPPQLFTPGNPSDDQVYTVGQVMTWDVSLEISGIQASGSGSGYPVWGAANVVYNLELRKGSGDGELAGEAVFFSSGNPGTAAAFARSFEIEGAGPGRLIDPLTLGGPYLDVHTYPTDAGDGRLLGMGAGYSGWRRSPPAETITTPGVGMDLLPDGSQGLGAGPITEGQIDTSLMEPGVYVLKVIPGSGFNVLRGDIDLWQDQFAFATAVDQTIGDEITFTLIPEPTTLTLLAFGGIALLRRRR